MLGEIFGERGVIAFAGAATVAKDVALANADDAAEGAAEFDRGGDQRIEHRLQIERRAADDLQHVGGRGLQLQRFLEIVGLGLDRVEQAHVLDRDDRLVGEGSHQFDRTIAEQAGLWFTQHEHAFDLAVAQQRNAEQRAHVHSLRGRHLEFRIRLVVGNLLDLPGERHTPGDAVAPGATRASVARVLPRDLRAEGRLGAEDVAVPEIDDAVARAEPHRRIHQRLQDRFQPERRAADDLQHVGGGGLLLQRLGEVARACLHLVEQAHVLDRDHGLVGEGLRRARSGAA